MEAEGDVSSIWITATHVGDLDGFLGFRLWIGPVLVHLGNGSVHGSALALLYYLTNKLIKTLGIFTLRKFPRVFLFFFFMYFIYLFER